jgi:predicted nucleic acid-binding protein
VTAAIVIDASAAVEIIARTEIGVRLQGLIPAAAAPWVPDGLFDAEVLAVLRRWELRSTLSAADVAGAFHRLTSWRLRRGGVTTLTAEAWTMRHNITFTDACHLALARRLDAPLLTTDAHLAAAPNLPVKTLGAS